MLTELCPNPFSGHMAALLARKPAGVVLNNLISERERLIQRAPLLFHVIFIAAHFLTPLFVFYVSDPDVKYIFPFYLV